MSDENQQKAEVVTDVKPNDELSPEALSDVNGGVTKVDKPSPTLFKLCSSGEHIKTATIE